MPEAAVQLRSWFPQADPTTLTPGVGSWYPLVSIQEPASIGLPPVTPDLARLAERNYASRSVRVRSGQLVTCGLGAHGRAAGMVVWTGLTRTQRDTLLTWLEATLVGPLLGFNVEPDGPGTGQRTVRATARPRDEWTGKTAWTVEVEVEGLHV